MRPFLYVFVALWVTASACRGEPDPRRFPIVGKVVAVSGDRVTLDHEPIPDVMAAMTMDLDGPPAEVRQLRAGDRVTATLVLDDRAGTRLEGIVVTGHEAPPVAAERWHDSLLVGEVLEAFRAETSTGPVLVGRGQGQVTVLTFLFTRCPLPEFCPLLSSKLASLQSRIAGARIVAVSLDPAHDTPAVLAEYGAAVGADPAVWTLGRVSEEELRALLDRVDVEVTPEGSTLSHNLRLLLFDADGRLVQRVKDNAWDVEAFAASVRAVVVRP